MIRCMLLGNPEGDNNMIDQLVEKVCSYPAKHVVISGGNQ